MRLTRKEKEVLLYLTREGPSTGSVIFSVKFPDDPDRKLLSKGGWAKVRKSLSDKKLIQRVQRTKKRGERGKWDKREVYYWPTPNGLLEIRDLPDFPDILPSLIRNIDKNSGIADWKQVREHYEMIRELYRRVGRKGVQSLSDFLGLELKVREALPLVQKMHPYLYGEIRDAVARLSNSITYEGS